jgi:glycosyltransferase involved in cell wall biosynthesis
MTPEFIKDNPLLLSIIVPAYNEAERLPLTLERIAPFAKACGFAVEVVVDV